jgi:short-subunit dehydrogenase
MSTPDLRALVTGASSGIGAAFARALRSRGERLILVARRRDRLEALAHELGGEAHVLVVPLDLKQPDSAERLKQVVESQGLAVDLLVNNAGLGHTGPFVDERPEVIRAMLDVNVRAVVELCHAFLPAMRQRGRGAVINVASNAAFQPVPFLTVYAATKAFVLSLSEGLSEELRGSGVRVQVLCPGTTATEFFEVAGAGEHLLARRLPLMSAEDVVRVSLAGLDRGRVRVVAGWPNRILAFATERLSPHAVARRVAGELYRPRKRSSPAGEGS